MKMITAQYNWAGELAILVYPSTRTVAFGPDALGRPLTAIDAASNITYAADTSYAAPGQLTSMRNGSNLRSISFFNMRLQLARVAVRNAGSAPTTVSDLANLGNIMDRSYDFALGVADNGNVVQIVNNRDSARSQAFTYDSLNRIASMTSATSYTYDYDGAWGNLIHKNMIGGTGTSFSQSANHYNRIDGWCYDAAGNLTRQDVCGSADYTYDAEGRMSSAMGAAFLYDGDGGRRSKSSAMLYWGSGPLAESDAQGNITAEYVYFGGKRIARQHPDGTVHYYVTDHIGSTMAVTDSTGTIEDTLDYDPWGGIAGISTERYLFTGKERDAETGLDNFDARMYASTMGRFMRPDDPFADQHPEDPQSWNLYSYVRNNPLSNTDPTGHECVSDGGGGWKWSGSGESCEDVDQQNQEYKQQGQASVTVNGCEGGGAADCLAFAVSDLTSTSSLSDVGVNGIMGAQAAEGIWSLPSLFRSGADLISGWRLASKMAGVRAAGEAGELAAGIVKNTERIPSVTGAAYRVPDILDHANKIIGEVKNYTTTTVSLTSQLKDDLAYAATNGYTVELKVRQGAQLSQSVQQLVNQGTIKLVRF